VGGDDGGGVRALRMLVVLALSRPAALPFNVVWVSVRALIPPVAPDLIRGPAAFL